MNHKFDLWTITFITKDGVHSMWECHSKSEALEELKELEKSGQDMDYVNIYPPKSNLTLQELEQYEED